MRMNQLKIGAMLNYIQLILGTILTIIITPVMLRYLGQSEYGIINLSASTVSYLNLITLGIGSAFVRFNVRYRTANDTVGEHKLNGTFLIIYIIMSIVMALVGAVLVSSCDILFAKSLTAQEIQRTKIVMAITVANMVISLPFSVFTMNINAYEKFVFGKAVNCLNTVLNPLIRLPILFLGGLSISLTIAMTVLHIATCVIQMVYALGKIKIKFKFGKMDKKLVKALLAFSSFIVLNQIIDLINWNVDKFILGVVGGTTVVAVYSLGATFNTYTMNFSTAISSVMTPRVHKLISSSAPMGEVQKLFNKIGRIQFILMAFIITAFVFFGKPFIMNFYADESYKDAYYIGILLIVPLIVPLIQNIGLEIQMALNKHKFRSILYVIIAIANVGISIPLAKAYGGIGSAIGTCLSLIIGNGLIMNIYYHKAIKLNIWSFWWEILKFLPSLILPIATGVLLMIYVDMSNIWIFLACALGYTSIYLLSMFFIGMNKYEKNLIIGPITKIFRKRRSIDGQGL